MALEDIRAERLEKLQKLKADGTDPYPASTQRTHAIADLRKKFTALSSAKKTVVAAGRVMARREHGGSMFLDIFDGFYATNGSPKAKGIKIVSLLKKYKLPKSRALMVGDSYHYDYLSAKSVGVEAVLLRSDYLKHPARGRRPKKIVNEIQDILKFI